MRIRDKLNQLEQSKRRNDEHEQQWKEDRNKLSRAEMEVLIRFDADERIAHIYASYPAYIRKLDRLVEAHPETYRCVKADAYSKSYEAPADRIRFGSPATEAQKAAGRALHQKHD